MKSNVLAGAVAGLVTLGCAAGASAAPVTVPLRVEGPTKTLVERSVTVDVRPFKFSNSGQTYTCDGTGSTGTTTVPSPTRNGALAEAAERDGFELTGKFSSFGPSFERINGESVAYDGASMRYLVEYKNGVASQFGGCGDTIQAGDDVLYAYGTGSESLLKLAGPATVKPGQSATLTVTTQPDGAAAPGASVAGAVSGVDGKATTPALTQRGPVSFKATRTGAIRSNAVTVCVTDGADGFCGTTVPSPTAPSAPMPTPPEPPRDMSAAFADITSIAEGQRFARADGPRSIAGKVDPEPAGIKDVRLRLSRTDGRRCYRFDGAKERLVRARKCGVKNARTFSVGASSDISYLLPSALPRGRYVLDVIVQDRAGHQTRTYQRGRNRVVFFVG